MYKGYKTKKYRRGLSIFVVFLMILSCVTIQPIAYADSNQETARLEIKIQADEGQNLPKDETFSAEIWLYNVSNIASGNIYVKGQTFEYEKTSWNTDAGISEVSKFSKITMPPILAGDKIDIKLTEGKSLSADESGVKLCTLSVKMSDEGVPSLSFGGVGIKTFECMFKDENGAEVYKKDKSTETIMTSVSYASSSPTIPQQYEVWDSSWSQFQGGVKHSGVTEIATPKGGAFQNLMWTAKLGTGYQANAGMPLLIGDYLYATSNTELLRINKETGIVEKRCTLSGSTGWNTVYHAYGVIGAGDNRKGVIFVSLAGGQLEAIEATTMKSLWVAQAKTAQGQNQCPILFDEETQYVYTGYWQSEEAEAPYICVDANTGEIVWEKLHRGGFYWAGATIIGNYLIVGSDNGDDGSGGIQENNDRDLSTLYVFNKKTGVEIDKTKTLVGDQRGSITAADNGKIYFTTKGGFIYSAKIDDYGKIIGLKGIESAKGQQATSTPVVYGGRVYYGVGSLSGKNCFLIVADSETLEEIYRVEMPGYPQGSPLLSTAYTGEENGTVYIYSTYNFPAGGLILIKDKQGQTTPNSEELFIPSENMRQYCLSSIVPDKDGTLYYINDSGNLFAIKKNEAYINNIGIKDDEGNTVSLVKSKSSEFNNAFVAGYVFYYATTGKDAKAVTLSFDIDNGIKIEVDGEVVSANSYTTDIPETGVKKVIIKAIKGSESREYIIELQKASSDVSIDILGLSQGQTYDFYQYPYLKKLTPELNYSSEQYRFEASNFPDELRLAIRTANPYANIKLKTLTPDVVDGSDAILDDKGFFTNGKKEFGLYTNNFGVKDTKQTYPTIYSFKPKADVISGCIDFVLTVTAEDGVTEKDYHIKSEIDRRPPKITNLKLTKNSENKIGLSFNSDEDGKWYFLIKKISEGVPNVGDILSANSVDIKSGENTIEIGKIDGDYILYYLTEDKALNYDKINSIRLSSDISPADNNIAVYFRLIGSTLAEKDIDLGKEDGYNGAKYVTWISNRRWSIDRNSNVGDLFQMAAEKAGLKSIGIQQNYVKTVYAPSALGGYALSEFTNGKRSGWMYSLNGKHPNKGLLQQPLNDGDVVVWHYVNDYAYEVEDWGSLGGTSYPALGDGKFYNKWLEAPDIAPPEILTDAGTEVATAKDGNNEVTTVKTEVKKGSETAAGGATINTATVTVKEANAAEMVKQAKENKSSEIVLDAKVDEADADMVRIELPKKVADNILADTKADLTVKLPDAEVKLSQTALKEIASQAKGDKLIVEVSKIKNPTDEQKKSAGNSAEVFGLTVKSGDNVIHSFGAGKVNVRKLIPERLTEKKIAAIYIPEKGDIEIMSGKRVTLDKKNWYEFTTSHFSDFALVDAEEVGIEVGEAMTSDEVKAVVKELRLKATTKALKKSIRVTVKADKEALMKLKESGYEVKYKYYRAVKKSGRYKLIATKKADRYADTKVTKGKTYYYKARLAVYDGEGKLIAITSLKNCNASKRQLKKAV